MGRSKETGYFTVCVWVKGWMMVCYGISCLSSSESQCVPTLLFPVFPCGLDRRVGLNSDDTFELLQYSAIVNSDAKVGALVSSTLFYKVDNMD